MLTCFLVIPGSKRLMREFDTYALLGSPRLAWALFSFRWYAGQRNEQRNGCFKTNCQILFSPPLFKQNELTGLYMRHYSLNLDITM